MRCFSDKQCGGPRKALNAAEAKARKLLKGCGRALPTSGGSVAPGRTQSVEIDVSFDFFEIATLPVPDP